VSTNQPLQEEIWLELYFDTPCQFIQSRRILIDMLVCGGEKISYANNTLLYYQKLLGKEGDLTITKAELRS